MSAVNTGSAHPLLAVLINDKLQLRYDRKTALPVHQLEYLERMDRKMDTGIRLGVDWIDNPDPLQRASFVAMQLVDGLQQGSDAVVAASCAYLAERMPGLKQVKARMLGAGISVELVFDKPYVDETIVDFVPRRSGD